MCANKNYTVHAEKCNNLFLDGAELNPSGIGYLTNCPAENDVVRSI